MKLILITLLVICVPLKETTSFTIGINEILDIIKVAKDIVVGLAKTWSIIDEHIDFDDIPVPIFDKTQKKLFGRINTINQKLDRIGIQVESAGTSTITTLLHTLPDRIRLELRLNDLLDYLTRIDVLHKYKFQQYVNGRENFERLTLEDFAKSVVSHDPSSIYNLMERIHAFIMPNQNYFEHGLLELLQKSFQTM